ncbi:MAG: asparaginase [Endozoicomonadaceae bacterium]|nr:asparaginase [Endozoicomonadaceae bacterium]
MNKKPKIHILATGGTIAGAGETSVGAVYEPGKMNINDILKLIPAINEIADISGEQFINIGSQDITATLWLKLARHIRKYLASDEVDGIVITHGTDTIEETAYFLNLIIPFSKPVVLTGSMRPTTAYSTDGPANLFNAILVASSKNSIGKGVLVTANEKIFNAHGVSKIATTHIDAFADCSYGPVGYVNGADVEFQRSVKKIHTVKSVFAKTLPKSLPEVVILYSYAGINTMLFDACIKAQVNGIVFAGTGNGNVPKPFLSKVKKAREKNIHIVRASRMLRGEVVTGELSDEKLGTIASGALIPQKAKILLQLALTITNDLLQIREIFKYY